MVHGVGGINATRAAWDERMQPKVLPKSPACASDPHLPSQMHCFGCLCPYTIRGGGTGILDRKSMAPRDPATHRHFSDWSECELRFLSEVVADGNVGIDTSREDSRLLPGGRGMLVRPKCSDDLGCRLRIQGLALGSRYVSMPWSRSEFMAFASLSAPAGSTTI